MRGVRKCRKDILYIDSSNLILQISLSLIGPKVSSSFSCKIQLSNAIGTLLCFCGCRAFKETLLLKV